MGDLTLYNEKILPHLLSPSNHLQDGDDGFYNQDQMLYLRSCASISSQNHLISILQNNGEVWDEAAFEQ
jgi:hypothetical protein